MKMKNKTDIKIKSELELMQHLLNKYNDNLTLVSSTDYVLGTKYDQFVPYSSCDTQDIVEYMSDFSEDENDYRIYKGKYSIIFKDKKIKYTITSVFLDNDLILIAGKEKDIIYHLHYILMEYELNVDYTNLLTNNTLINSLIDQRIEEIMTGNTPDTDIMLSERTATLL